MVEPAEELHKDVLKWNNTMECVPTWEELLEVEYIRQRGECNMFTDNVQRWAYDHGLFNAVVWYDRCCEAHIHPSQLYSQACAMYEKEHGSVDTWVTEEVKVGFLKLELEQEEIRLAEKRRELKRKQSQFMKRSVQNPTKKR